MMCPLIVGWRLKISDLFQTPIAALFTYISIGFLVQNISQSAIRNRQSAIIKPFSSLEACNHCAVKA